MGNLFGGLMGFGQGIPYPQGTFGIADMAGTSITITDYGIGWDGYQVAAKPVAAPVRPVLREQQWLDKRVNEVRVKL